MNKIIFDLDNTLLIWKDEYINVLIEVLNEFGIYENYEEINDIIDTYDKNCKILDKEDLLNRINNRFNYKLDMSFMDRLLENQGKKCCIISPEIKPLLEYLNKKYELYILTNWFTNCQVARLKNTDTYKYFKEVYCGDKITVKPNKEAFLNVIKDSNPKEYTVIGDSYESDIKPALELNMNAIWLTKKEDDKKVKKIKSLEELYNILWGDIWKK